MNNDNDDNDDVNATLFPPRYHPETGRFGCVITPAMVGVDCDNDCDSPDAGERLSPETAAAFFDVAGHFPAPDDCDDTRKCQVCDVVYSPTDVNADDEACSDPCHDLLLEHRHLGLAWEEMRQEGERSDLNNDCDCDSDSDDDEDVAHHDAHLDTRGEP